MNVRRRVEGQPAWILHHRPYRDSSQLLDILSPDHGKSALVARGSRGAKSRLKGILRPFLPLRLSWVQRSDLGTLTGAEARGASIRLTGDALLSGYYVNELLLNFLHRHDPQPELFVAYEAVIRELAGKSRMAASLRTFEMELLREVGYAVNLDQESGTGGLLEGGAYYEYRVEQGPVRVRKTTGDLVFAGAVLTAISQREFDDAEVLQAAARLLREVISFHLGGRELKTRKVLLELHRQRRPASES